MSLRVIEQQQAGTSFFVVKEAAEVVAITLLPFTPYGDLAVRARGVIVLSTLVSVG